MTRLNQILGVVKGRKQTSQAAWTQVFQNIQKAPLVSGISRTYQPKDDEGDRLPPESTKVQLSTMQALVDFEKAVSPMLNSVAELDEANMLARGDVVVDGAIILAGVPATTLMFLAKHLVDVRTFVSKLPVLDPSEDWTLDNNTGVGVYRSEPKQTTRTAKVPKNWVKSPATDKFPAQVEMFTEDVIVGNWTTVKFSGAMPAADKARLMERVVQLQEAVVAAQEQANMVTVPEDIEVAENIFNYLTS